MSTEHTPGPWAQGATLETEQTRHWTTEQIEEDARMLAAAPELLCLVRGLVDMLGNCSVESGVCCCGDDMRSHADPMNCGHSPVDSGAYAALSLYERAVEVLAKATGEEPSHG